MVSGFMCPPLTSCCLSCSVLRGWRVKPAALRTEDGEAEKTHLHSWWRTSGLQTEERGRGRCEQTWDQQTGLHEPEKNADGSTAVAMATPGLERRAVHLLGDRDLLTRNHLRADVEFQPSSQTNDT